MHPHGLYLGCKVNQRGAALMIMIVILVVGFAAALVGSLSLTALKNARQEKNAAALAHAKDALIGYAVSDDTRPGELPCPDVDGDGMLTMGVDYGGGGACVQYVGRLPWKTLGLSELRDGDNETLWYALSIDFRAGNSVVLNSNTKGTLLVYDTDGTTLQTQAGYSAVAVIFAPGSPVGSQTRNTVAEKNSAANYLDIANTRNNATVGGPFIAGAKSDTFNDQLLYITTRNLMPLIEQRVAGVVKKALTDYFNWGGSNYYPWADTIGPTASYDADDGVNRGWLPDVASTGSTHDWVAGSPPQWFFDNEWYSLIYYSVGKNYTKNPGGCSTCGGGSTLLVDGVSGVKVLFFMPGTPIGTITRAINQLSDYLETQPGPTQNNDDADDNYVTPTSQARDRDRLYRFSSTWTP